MNSIRYIAIFLMSLALLACGGGGGSAGTSSAADGTTAPAPQSPASTPTQITAVTPAIIEVLTSTNTLPSAGAEAVITAQVKNSTNVGLTGQLVTFSATSGSLQVVTGVTDAAGVASAKLTAGVNKSNRDITVTASSTNVSSTVTVTNSITVPVTGTKISIVGTGSIQVGAPVSQFTARAVDSSGNGISGAALIFSSSLGNGLSASSPTTDFNGSITLSYTPTTAGNDVVTVSGLGTNAATSVVVNAVDFSVVSPISNTLVPVGTSQSITFQYRLNGSGVSGQTVFFSSTRGTIAQPSQVTDGAGQVTVAVSSTTAGPANVTAQITGIGSVNLPLQFVATTPASIVIQVNPGSVLPNESGSSANQSTLSATVRDSSGNPVAGQTVSFSATQDGSNGTISPGSGTTDSNGNTSVQFTPGALSTATNGVVVRAVVQSNPAIFSTATLTVNGNALFISIAVANTLTAFDSTTYQKDFSVYVTDANGAPSANRAVTISAFPLLYKKGSLILCTVFSADCVGALQGWEYKATTSPTSCSNEDDISSTLSDRRNGVLNSGEDINGNSQLDPGLPVVISPSSLVTDAFGYATFKMRYGKNYALWVTTQITARALVSGTESSKTAIYDLEMTSQDAGNLGATPANVVSPFGIATDCADPS